MLDYRERGKVLWSHCMIIARPAKLINVRKGFGFRMPRQLLNLSLLGRHLSLLFEISFPHRPRG